MSSAVAIIQARLNSTRLPGKILMDLGGKPLLQHVIDRAREIAGVDDVVVAVPDLATFNAVTTQTADARVAWYGEIAEENVLGRYAAVARQFVSHDVIVRLTADNPLIDPVEAATVLAEYRARGLSYHSNLVDGYVDGSDVEVFSRELLLELDNDLPLDDPRRAHVTPAMGQPVIKKFSKTKLSVDTAEDLERVRAMLEADE
jgi:spore coat polysaccharide biosynthesis protein SpsF (cytidylyltransferase family)